MKTVMVIDYGMSNLRSVSKALAHVAENKWQVQVSDNASEILAADKIVFPGQGAIGNCMQLLAETGLDEVIRASLHRKPFLGICLGQQSLLTHSEESGGVDGFDFIPGRVCRFPSPLRMPDTDVRLKIPHMGWSPVMITQPQHPLWQGIPSESAFYFVHSYYVQPKDCSVDAGVSVYGNIRFSAAVAKDNVFAVQFHPEKSQEMGLRLLKNFLQW